MTSAVLADLVLAAGQSVWFDAPPADTDDVIRRLRFGAQLDARPVTGAADRDAHEAQLHPETVAAYIAKYATKAAADLPTDHGHPNGHLQRLQGGIRTLAGRAMVAALDGRENPYQGWGRWVEMLGFRGHLATKSRRYSVTLGRLRQARRNYTRRHARPMPEPAAGWADEKQAEVEDTTLVIGSWRFSGMGWLTSGDAALAVASATRARDD